MWEEGACINGTPGVSNNFPLVTCVRSYFLFDQQYHICYTLVDASSGTMEGIILNRIVFSRNPISAWMITKFTHNDHEHIHAALTLRMNMLRIIIIQSALKIVSNYIHMNSLNEKDINSRR